MVNLIGGATVSIVIRAVDDFTRTFHRASTGMGLLSKASKIGAAAVAGTGVAMAVAGVAATKMAADYNTSLTKTQALVGATKEEINNLSTGVQKMAGEVGKTPKELADGLYFVESAGFRGKEALSVLNNAAKASSIGLGSVATTSDLVTSAMNAWGPSAVDATKATNVLIATVREGKAEPAELASSMGMVFPVASAMGVSFNEVGAAMAGMTRTGTPAATAAMELRQILSSLLKPTPKATAQLKEMGLSASGLRDQIKSKGLLSVLTTLKDKFGDNTDATAQVFGNIRALTGVMDLLGANSKDNIGIFKRMADTTGTLDTAWKTTQENSPALMLKQLKAEASKLMIELGNVLLPVIKQLMPVFLDILKAIDPIIPAIGDLLVNAIKTLLPVVVKLMPHVQKWINFSGELLKALMPLLPPIMELGGTLLDALLNVMIALMPAIKSLVPPLVELIHAVIPLIPPFTEILIMFAEMITSSPTLIVLIKTLAGALVWFFDKVKDGIDFVRTLVGLIKELVDWVQKIESGVLNWVIGAVNTVTGSHISSVGDAIIKPDGSVITTHPDDYLIQLKPRKHWEEIMEYIFQ